MASVDFAVSRGETVRVRLLEIQLGTSTGNSDGLW